MSEKVFIVGVGMIKFGKHQEKGIKQLTGEAGQVTKGRERISSGGIL